jgi:hypothetical protein
MADLWPIGRRHASAVHGRQALGLDRDVSRLSAQSTIVSATGFQFMLRSASSDRAAAIGREQIETHHQQTMQRLIRRDPVPERAALALAIVAGVQLLRQTMAPRPIRRRSNAC